MESVSFSDFFLHFFRFFRRITFFSLINFLIPLNILKCLATPFERVHSGIFDICHYE